MIQFGRTVLVDETEHPYGQHLTIDVMSKAHNIIQVHSETGDMNFIKVKNVEGISGVLGFYFNIGVSDMIMLHDTIELIKSYGR